MEWIGCLLVIGVGLALITAAAIKSRSAAIALVVPVAGLRQSWADSD